MPAPERKNPLFPNCDAAGTFDDSYSELAELTDYQQPTRRSYRVKAKGILGIPDSDGSEVVFAAEDPFDPLSALLGQKR